VKHTEPPFAADRKQMNARIATEVRDAAKHAAIEDGRTFEEEVEHLLRLGLEAREARK
jgi:hypothetical protein